MNGQLPAWFHTPDIKNILASHIRIINIERQGKSFINFYVEAPFMVYEYLPL